VRDAGFLYEHGYTRAPQIVQWIATARCPLSCPHCLTDSSAKRNGEMSTQAAYSLIDQVAALGVGEFLITGGEPLTRTDLPKLIERLATRNVGWSLNTACMPSAEQRRTIEKCPPMFVAVSLDGPREVHDKFRGRYGAYDDALQAIRYFSSLPCPTAAGTTVTTDNFAHLSETFGIVTTSGATNWGIHLPVKEGRAAERSDLFLSRPQLKRLLKFVAKKRNYFSVTMADEFGYCGDWEPLVRDLPLFCGAGRTQCVVLPDGNVVPCTTLDTSTSAGNLNERTLRDIWENGFKGLRASRTEGRCTKCEYAAACQGGCWLQHRHGTPCYRDVWDVPTALKSAAGIAVVLGALAAGMDSCPILAASADSVVGQAVQGAGNGIEGWIVVWYGQQLGPVLGRWRRGRQRLKGKAESVEQTAQGGPSDELARDPAGAYFLRHIDGSLPRDIEGCCQAVRESLDTKERSLAFAALLTRNLLECCMNGPAPADRSPTERKALRDTMAQLRAAAEAWRREIFAKKLDPYLMRGRKFAPYAHDASKASRPHAAWIRLTRDLAMERWDGKRYGPRGNVVRDSVDGFLERHPCAEPLQLDLSGLDPGLRIVPENPEHTATATIGPWDLLVVPEKYVRIGVRSHVDPDKRSFAVTLPAGTELTYIDLVVLVDRANPEIGDTVGEETVGQGINSRAHAKQWHYVGEPNPLFVPAAMRLLDQLNTDPTEEQQRSFQYESSDQRWIVKRWLIDFWMF